MRDRNARPRLFPLILAAVALVSCMFFYLSYRLDNKYTMPRPYASMGVTQLNMDWYDSHPFFYIVDGWSFYRDKLLTPEEVEEETPDEYLYLGQYGGFDLGEPSAEPHGYGTYRMVVLLDGAQRTYALELTRIYSRWKLWVNGELMQNVGFEEPNAPAPDSRMVTFSAADRIEIVVEVEDDRGFYSGMVYPPALGTPEAVGYVGSVRLLLHGGACAAALLLGLLCLLMGARAPGSELPYFPLALLSLCFCVSTAWPVFQALDLDGTVLPLLERLCYYGIFLSLVWIQGRICTLPRNILSPVVGAGALVCLSILLQPFFHADTAGPLIFYAHVLGAWKWLCAGWLLVTGIWAAQKKRPGSRVLLCGNCFFAAALVMDNLLPLHEPILLGWFVEIAGGGLMILTAGLLWQDTARIYREGVELRARQTLNEIQLTARSEQARLQTEYVKRTQKQLHESRNRLTLIRHYLDEGDYDALRAYLDELVPTAGGPGTGEHTGHGLIDAILTAWLERAAQLSAYVEKDFCSLPQDLPIADNDLTSILMNLLDNALEAVERLKDPEERWISFSIERKTDSLRFTCVNAMRPSYGKMVGTSKEDKEAHGFGLMILQETAGRYGGNLEIEKGDDSFEARVTIPLNDQT